MDIKNLNVGDDVAYYYYHRYSAPDNFNFAKVERITKTTIVLDNGFRFNKHGKELKSKDNPNPRHQLYNYNDAQIRTEKREEEAENHRLIFNLKEKLEGKRKEKWLLNEKQKELINLLLEVL